MRIDKFLAHNGFGSRNEVKKLLKEKHVYVNGKVIVKPSFKLNLDVDEVVVDDEAIKYSERVYYMINKPKGYICSHDTTIYPSILELIDTYRDDLIIVGRLDVDTEGLLLISSDGKFSHRIAHGKNNVYKKYYVELEYPFDEKYIEEFKAGITLSDAVLKPAYIEMIDKQSLYISISEGRYHQVKRMMKYANNEVMYLQRVQIGNLELDESLQIGEYRELTAVEIENIDK